MVKMAKVHTDASCDALFHCMVDLSETHEYICRFQVWPTKTEAGSISGQVAMNA